jgi:hypothetical protein
MQLPLDNRLLRLGILILLILTVEYTIAGVTLIQLMDLVSTLVVMLYLCSLGVLAATVTIPLASMPTTCRCGVTLVLVAVPDCSNVSFICVQCRYNRIV